MRNSVKPCVALWLIPISFRWWLLLLLRDVLKEFPSGQCRTRSCRVESQPRCQLGKLWVSEHGYRTNEPSQQRVA
jgi:hypothetical protein